MAIMNVPLSARDVARMFKVGEMTVKRALDRGELTGHQRGPRSQWMILQGDAEAWIARRGKMVCEACGHVQGEPAAPAAPRRARRAVK
jgi:hypothetical protein